MPEPSHDRHNELGETTVTSVQLHAGERARKRFLHQLQAALGTGCSLSCLTPGPSAHVYVIPQAAEQQARRLPELASDAGWENQLRQWGARSVNRLSRDLLFALTQRGGVAAPAGAPGPVKLSSPGRAPAVRALPTSSALPMLFRGPFDWHLDERGANVVKAWDLFAADLQFRSALPWGSIRVGHIDTGYTEHSALAWTGGHSSTVNVGAGFDFWDGPAHPDPRDEWLPGFPGHGTRTSSTIAGFLVDGPAQPFYGAAPGAAIVPYRVTDSVIIDHVKDKVGAAIRHAVDGGCGVINISLGALFGSRHLSGALDHAHERGVIVACAAGNVWGEVIYPGRYNRCITVGGVGPGMRPWSGSAHGQYVDLCAPSDVIRRVKAQPLPPGTAASGIEPKVDGDGTSYGTALCSGVAALWLAYHGVDALRARYAAGGLWQIPRAFKHLLRQTAVVPAGWDRTEYGNGIINAAALLAAPLPSNGALPPVQPAAGVYDPND